MVRSGGIEPEQAAKFNIVRAFCGKQVSRCKKKALSEKRPPDCRDNFAMADTRRNGVIS